MNNEFIRMQKLAGLITESEYKAKKSLVENEKNISPEQVVDSTSKIVDKIKSDPKIDALTTSIANDPKKKQELLDLSKKLGINPLNLNESMEDPSEKLALMFAKKAKNEINEEDATTQASLSFTGLLAGLPLAPYLAQKLGVFTTTYVNAWGETLNNPEAWVPFAGMAAGAIAGWILGEIINKVFDIN